MGDLPTIVIILILIFGILNLILFFKIWGATNNIKNIYNLLIQNNFKPTTSKESQNKYTVNSLVVNLVTNKQMRIKAIENGKYLCYSNGGLTFEGEFAENEIKLF